MCPSLLLHSYYTAYTLHKDWVTVCKVIQEARGDRKRGKRPRISDDADDDPPEPVVAVKHAKCIPFSNEELQQIKVFMEGHGGKGGKVHLHLCGECLESHELDRTPKQIQDKVKQLYPN